MNGRIAATTYALVLLTPWGARAQEADDGKLLAGTWEVTSGEQGGRELTKAMLGGQRLVFAAGGTYRVLLGDNEVESGTYRIDPGKTPREIDLKITRGQDAGKAQLGIYKLEGDSLVLTFQMAGEADRPEEFETKAGGGRFLLRLKREVDEAPPPAPERP
jgi:uncharacterized protein (TIGR03067 family)